MKNKIYKYFIDNREKYAILKLTYKFRVIAREGRGYGRYYNEIKSF